LPFPVYLDADVHPVVARILRGRGFDVLSTDEAGRPQASDREQLDFSVRTGRAIVTFNVADFVREARGYADEGRDHCGIIVSDQLEVGELVRRLTRVLGRYSAAEMINRFVWLQSFA
jgi:predicted nuclease of predicted toxin-antitoxin system